MTRCLNCGSERDADVCDYCGLNSAAAEFSLRKKLLNRTAIFLVGAILFVAATGMYPALDSDEMLIFGGILFFAALALAIVVERRAVRHAETEALKRVYYGLIPVPWILGALLMANGALDASAPHIEETRVVSKFSMRGPVPSRRLIVRSWREGHWVERLPVTFADFDRFNRGDAIEVKVKDGLTDIPWVESVSHP
ncbi:MAG: hypothetical protein KGL02_01525 [Acidobacteriota bacterium]|nr:hypothetical protein [Acidobacteriota bacterium]